jgi:hypothetical protein
MYLSDWFSICLSISLQSPTHEPTLRNNDVQALGSLKGPDGEPRRGGAGAIWTGHDCNMLFLSGLHSPPAPRRCARAGRRKGQKSRGFAKDGEGRWRGREQHRAGCCEGGGGVSGTVPRACCLPRTRSEGPDSLDGFPAPRSRCE